MPLSLLQLNIEKDRHLDKVRALIEERRPDVLCVQELLEKDIPLFAPLFKNACYSSMALLADRDGLNVGVGIFTGLDVVRSAEYRYAGSSDPLPLHAPSKLESMSRTLLVQDIEKDGTIYRIGTTHFTWTPAGEPDDYQRRDLKELLAALEKEGELVFTGDFNAPRGGEIFDELASSFTDNVPAEYTSSIDGDLHRSGPLPYMVDGIFSTLGYEVTDVEMACGVSDHCALVGRIEKI